MRSPRGSDIVVEERRPDSIEDESDSKTSSRGLKGQRILHLRPDGLDSTRLVHGVGRTSSWDAWAGGMQRGQAPLTYTTSPLTPGVGYGKDPWTPFVAGP